MMEFDDVFTARMHGYQGVRDYYAKNSSGPFLKNISARTLILTAEDDPLVPIESFPIKEIEANSNIEFIATKHGGHVGWVNIRGFRIQYWMEEKMVDWITLDRK